MQRCPSGGVKAFKMVATIAERPVKATSFDHLGLGG
jgi:hypothetical protein